MCADIHRCSEGHEADLHVCRIIGGIKQDFCEKLGAVAQVADLGTVHRAGIVEHHDQFQALPGPLDLALPVNGDVVDAGHAQHGSLDAGFTGHGDRVGLIVDVYIDVLDHAELAAWIVRRDEIIGDAGCIRV